MTVSSWAASVTLRAIGPSVSWLADSGMTPARLTRPTVGLTPTRPLQLDGDTIEPSVSLPIAAAHRLAATATPDPLLEPDGDRSGAYGLRHCPPRPLQPDDDAMPRKLAHSDRLVLPRMIAPAARSFWTTNASASACEPSSASDPAVVVIWSPVSML